MKKYISFSINADSYRHIDLCSEMNLESGVKRLAVSASENGIQGYADYFALPVPKADNSIAHYEFPVVDGKSPCRFTFFNKGTQVARVYIIVEELGGMPYGEYFTE